MQRDTLERDILECPILHKEMTDPYITSCGHTFEEKAIKECLITKKECPCCQHTVSHLTPNLALKSAIPHIKMARAKVAELTNKIQTYFPSSESKIISPSEKDIAIKFSDHINNRIQKAENDLAAQLFKRARERKKIVKPLQRETKNAEGKDEKKEPESLMSNWHNMRAEDKELKKQHEKVVKEISIQMKAIITSLEKTPCDTKLIEQISQLTTQLTTENTSYQEKSKRIKENRISMLQQFKLVGAQLMNHHRRQDEIRLASKQLNDLRTMEVKHDQEQVEKDKKEIETTPALFGGNYHPITSQEKLNSAFCLAVSNGNVSEAKDFLIKGAKVNSALKPNDKQVPPLWKVIARSDETMIDLLLAHRINLNLYHPNTDDWNIETKNYSFQLHKNRFNSSLQIAAFYHHNKSCILTKLLKHGATIEDESSAASLKFAIVSYNIDAVRILIEHGASFNLDDIISFEKKIHWQHWHASKFNTIENYLRRKVTYSW